MNKHTTSTCYLIHFLHPLGNPNSPRGRASHYIGFSEYDLAARLERHRAGNGSKIMAAVTKQQIPWVLTRTWEGGSRDLERKLKARKQASAFCPICRGEQQLPAPRVIGRRPMSERPVQFYR
jgi:predicted GIY-YIG superfamily endonuclease